MTIGDLSYEEWSQLEDDESWVELVVDCMKTSIKNKFK